MRDKDDCSQEKRDELRDRKGETLQVTLPNTAQNAITGAVQSVSRSLLSMQEPLSHLSAVTEELQKRIAHSAAEIVKSSQFSFELTEAFGRMATTISKIEIYALNDSIREVLNHRNTMVEQLLTPTLEWLRRIDISERLKSISIDPDLLLRYEEINEIYLKTMCKAKWFPYIVWNVDIAQLKEINVIINTSQYGSKNQEKRIDKAIITYYTKTEIRTIKKAWWNTTGLDYCTRKMLTQAMNAYLRGEYALTISCLVAMWEGFIYTKAKNVPISERKRQPMGNTKQDLKNLVADNDYDPVYSDYFNNYIVSQCGSINEVIDGVPNRHGVAHSWYRKYPNKKAALNAILFTDFLINLKPIKKTDEELKTHMNQNANENYEKTCGGAYKCSDGDD